LAEQRSAAGDEALSQLGAHSSAMAVASGDLAGRMDLLKPSV
jgi:hypothetical protein